MRAINYRSSIIGTRKVLVSDYLARMTSLQVLKGLETAANISIEIYNPLSNIIELELELAKAKKCQICRELEKLELSKAMNK